MIHAITTTDRQQKQKTHLDWSTILSAVQNSERKVDIAESHTLDMSFMFVTQLMEVGSEDVMLKETGKRQVTFIEQNLGGRGRGLIEVLTRHLP
jgi:hypothetical protein